MLTRLLKEFSKACAIKQRNETGTGLNNVKCKKRLRKSISISMIPKGTNKRLEILMLNRNCGLKYFAEQSMATFRLGVATYSDSTMSIIAINKFSKTYKFIGVSVIDFRLQ